MDHAPISALALAQRVADGLDPAEALRAGAAAFAAREGKVRAFVAVDEAVLAGRVPPGHGPLGGLALGVKDIIHARGLPTGNGLPGTAAPESYDAPLVMMARRAGASVLGKTATTPFAFLDPAATRNPRDLARTPGGSSSGSAAAVAAGFVPLALGTQTGGSVVRPASYCGVAAIKPSFGLLPGVGITTFSWSLDTPGLFAARARDLAFALGAITGRELAGEVTAPRLLLARQPYAGPPEAASDDALARAARACAAAGARVSEGEGPPGLAGAYDAHAVIQGYEAALALGPRRGALGAAPLLAAELDRGAVITPATYDDARRVARRARQVLRDGFADADAILTFSAPGVAPRFEEGTGSSRFNRVWTLMGCPCVNVPGLTDPATGLPVGVQIVVAHGADRLALAVAAFVEDALRGA